MYDVDAECDDDAGPHGPSSMGERLGRIVCVTLAIAVLVFGALRYVLLHAG